MNAKTKNSDSETVPFLFFSPIDFIVIVVSRHYILTKEIFEVGTT